MRLFGILCILLLLFLPVNNLGANEAEDLLTVCRKATLQKNIAGYSAVCRYLYLREEKPELLALYADSIRQIGVRTKNVECFIEYYSWNSEACFMKGDFVGGYALKNKALSLAERMKNNSYITELCSDMGYYYNVDARYDSARYYLKKGMAVSKESPKLAEHYRTMLTNYASSYLYEGETDSALIYTEKAKERSVADKDTAMLIENLNQLGTLYRRKKHLELCISNFEEAIRLCEAQKNFKTAAFIYGNIATAYSDWDRPAEAIPFSQKALEYALKMKNPQMEGVCYINLGAILCNIESLREEGIVMVKKAIPLLIEVNNKRRLCEAYVYLADAYRRGGNLNAAVEYLNLLEKLSSELKTDVERYRYYRVKAPILQDQQQYVEAIKYYLRITDMLEKGYRDVKDSEHYVRLAACYAAIHEDRKAYTCLQKAYALCDLNYQEKYVDRLSDFSVRYKTKEKELEIIRLRQKELEQEAVQLHRRVVYGTTISTLLIFLLVLLYTRQRQKAHLSKLAQTAGEKERQFLALQQETEQRLSRKYIDGLESERERMATELHDDICNNLLALEINIRSLTDGDTKMNKQIDLLEETRERLRNISHELMPPVFQYATIDEMLADYVQHLTLPDCTQIVYRSTENVNWNLVPQKIGFEFYRIVQEAVSNAVKYADASIIQVILTLEENKLSVFIGDDGKGFDMYKKVKGIGLRTILQRAETIEAKVELNSVSCKGTNIEVTVRI